MGLSVRMRKISAVLLGLMALPFVIGPLLAPAVFNLMLWAGRSWPALESLRLIEFESVLARCILITGILMIYPVFHLLAKLEVSFDAIIGDHKLASLGRGLALGVLSMLIVPLAGLLAGAYRLDPEAGPAAFVAVLLGSLLAGLLAALIEELIFRGLLFRVLRGIGGTALAAIISAAIFALVHFINPVLPAGVVYGHWYSGFQTFAVALRSFLEFTVHIFPYSLTLFLIGLSLALLYARRGSLMLVVGVHAGWIAVLKTAADMLSRTDRSKLFFGDDMVLSKTYAVAVLSLLFLLGVLLANCLKKCRQ